MRPTNRSRLATTASTAATAAIVIAGILSVPTVASADRSYAAKSGRVMPVGAVAAPTSQSNSTAGVRGRRAADATGLIPAALVH